MPHPIVVPRLGWSMEEGVFLGWLKKEGEAVRVGEPLFELEGEKAVQEIEAVDAGVLRLGKQTPNPGTVVAVGAILGHLYDPGEPIVAEPVVPQPTAPVTSEARPLAPVPPRPNAPSTPAPPSVRRLARQLGVSVDAIPRSLTTEPALKQPAAGTARSKFASPRARKLAADLGIDWTQLPGSGRGGRVRESDVRPLARRAGEAIGSAKNVLVFSPRRKTIASRMLASQQRSAPVTLTVRVDASSLVMQRNQFRQASAPVVPTFTDLVAKRIASVLAQQSAFAGRWTEDRQGLLLPSENQIDLGIAVDTDDGLLVVVVRNILQLSLVEFAEQSRQLVERARQRRLAPADSVGSMFTVTNLGGFGIEAFTPILPYPETAILGLGAIQPTPMATSDGNIVVRQAMTLSLTFDHCAHDGAPAARFLQQVRAAIEGPDDQAG